MMQNILRAIWLLALVLAITQAQTNAAFDAFKADMESRAKSLAD